MNINIIVEDKILKLMPIIKPKIKKVIINKIFPDPIPKCDPTNAIQSEEYIIDKFVEVVLSINLTLKR